MTIRLSTKRKDSVFVTRTLRTLQLSLVPTPEYYDEPDYQWSNDGWSRVIERYPWGAVLYAENPTAAATMVLSGKIDFASGTVDGESIPLTWYPELVRRSRMKKPVEAPECAGYWIAGVTCDGGLNEQTGEHENVCSWRKRCRMIQAHMVKLNTDPQAYRSRYGPQSLMRLVERLEKGETPQRTKVKSKKKPRKKKQSPEARRVRRYAPLKEMAADFASVLAQAADGRKIVWCDRRTQAVKAGCVYLLDRTQNSAYYSMYLRRQKGRALKLAVVRLAPINGGLDVQLPDTAEPNGMPADLKWTTWKDTPMRSVVRTLKTNEHYAWMARMLVKAAAKALEAGE